MPRPPPPATALIMTAPPAPSEAKNAFASSSVVGPLGALDHRHAAAPGERLGFDLVAEQIERLGRRPDEDDTFLGATPRQQGILAEKAIAGMQRVASRRLRRRNHRLDIEIGARPPPGNFACARRPRERAATVRRRTGGWRRWRGRFRQRRGRCEWRSRRDWRLVTYERPSMVPLAGYDNMRPAISDPSWSDRARCVRILRPR